MRSRSANERAASGRGSMIAATSTPAAIRLRAVLRALSIYIIPLVIGLVTGDARKGFPRLIDRHQTAIRAPGQRGSERGVFEHLLERQGHDRSGQTGSGRVRAGGRRHVQKDRALRTDNGPLWVTRSHCWKTPNC